MRLTRPRNHPVDRLRPGILVGPPIWVRIDRMGDKGRHGDQKLGLVALVVPRAKQRAEQTGRSISAGKPLIACSDCVLMRPAEATGPARGQLDRRRVATGPKPWDRDPSERDLGRRVDIGDLGRDLQLDASR